MEDGVLVAPSAATLNRPRHGRFQTHHKQCGVVPNLPPLGTWPLTFMSSSWLLAHTQILYFQMTKPPLHGARAR
jgi:hypothetical protein